MSRIIYLTELFKRTEWEALYSTAADDYSRVNNIYYFDLSQDNTSYWATTWSGYFDTVTSSFLQILFDEFLIEVFSSAALIGTENTFFVDGNKVYMNLTFDSWQYFKQNIEVLVNDDTTSFSSSVGDTTKPYDWTFGTDKKYTPILNVPSLNNKLSDPISGNSLLSTFNFSIANDNGLFDDAENNNYFNTRINIKKTTVENPSLSDFKVIRAGIVESVDATFQSFGIFVADFQRFFTVRINKTFTVDRFPSLPSELEGKPMPICFNRVYGAKLIKVSSGFDYVACDPDNISFVDTVFDADGNSISFTLSAGIITTSVEAATANIVGTIKLDGQIIVDLISEFTFLEYISDYWDLTETNNYITLSLAAPGVLLNDSDLKTAIKIILKNKLGFLITKNDGRLTLREWGKTYDTHSIDSWQILNADKIKKDYKEAAKYYNSTVQINYGKNFDTGEYTKSYIDDSKELEIFSKYRKSKLVIYDTDYDELFGFGQAVPLATKLLDRYGKMNPLIKIELGYDTSEINILDQVNIDIVVNGRAFMQTSDFIVREVNPSQDVLLLESIGNVKIESAILDNFEFAILDNEENAIMGV